MVSQLTFEDVGTVHSENRYQMYQGHLREKMKCGNVSFQRPHVASSVPDLRVIGSEF